MMQAEGVHGIITCKAQAYAMVSTARYTGKGRMTYDQYAERHQRAHNELESLGEPVAETKKVSDFLAGITDGTLSTIKSIIDGDSEKNTDFSVCQQYLKTCVENAKTRSLREDKTRTISSAEQDAAKKQKARKAGKGAPPKRGKLKGSGHYTPAEFRALSDDQREALKELRRKQKERKAAAAETEERDVGQISFKAEGAPNVTKSFTPPEDKNFLPVPPKTGKFDPNHRTPEEIKLAKKLEAKIAKTDVQHAPQFGRNAHAITREREREDKQKRDWAEVANRKRHREEKIIAALHTNKKSKPASTAKATPMPSTVKPTPESTTTGKPVLKPAAKTATKNTADNNEETLKSHTGS